MKTAKLRKEIKEWGTALLFALVVFFIVRTFLFEAFTIPSSSMEQSLLAGDYVIVNKLAYGARIPMTPLSLPFVHQRFPFTENTKSYLDWIRIPYLRLPGFSEVERNDVVVFNYPMESDHPVDQRTFFIKRCVGIAGDTIEISEGQVYINGRELTNPEQMQWNHIIKIDSIKMLADLLRETGVDDIPESVIMPGYFNIRLTRKQADTLSAKRPVKLVESNFEKRAFYAEYIFPHSEKFRWNHDNFGPLYIPREGDSMRIDTGNIALYEHLISAYERNKVEVKNDSVFINGKFSTHYRFRMNYYFMMGDNRHASDDSRFWGFVPENHIVGRASFIIFSWNKPAGNLRWDRLFSSVE